MRTLVRQIVIVVCVYGLSFGSAPDIEAYEEISLSESGSLSGTVNLDGKVPMPKGYNLTTVPDPVYCGRISDGRGWRLLQPFDVGSKGEFRNVVVYLEGIDKGKPFGHRPGHWRSISLRPARPGLDRPAGQGRHVSHRRVFHSSCTSSSRSARLFQGPIILAAC